MDKKYSLRKFFNDVHLWLGIGSGLVLFVVCLSGTIYTFKAEIERLVSPSKYYTTRNAQTPKRPIDELVASLEKQYKGKVTSLVIPADPKMNYQVGIKPETQPNKAAHAGAGAGSEHGQSRPAGEKKAEGRKPEGRGGEAKGAEGKGGTAEVRPVTYFVDPYTGLVTGEQGGSTAKFFTTVMQLHRWLLMETSTGRIVVGIATIMFVFIILSGLVIWFPKRIKGWKRGLKVKFNANWKRINHDLHSALGFYSFILLLVMALTGLCWSFEWYKDGLSNVLGAKVFKGRGEKPLMSGFTADSTAFLPLGTLISNTDRVFNYKGDTRITLPSETFGAVSVTKNKTGFFAMTGADKVQLDRFSGRELKLERFADKRFNEKIADSIKPIHTGEIYGLFSKIIYFIVCLFATSLPVTGTIIWINKLRKGRRSKAPIEGTSILAQRKEKTLGAKL